MKKSIGDI